jgi:hypothetical protein
MTEQRNEPAHGPKVVAARWRQDAGMRRGASGGETRTTLLSVATTYEHIAESVERDVGRGRLPDPTGKPRAQPAKGLHGHRNLCVNPLAAGRAAGAVLATCPTTGDPSPTGVILPSSWASLSGSTAPRPKIEVARGIPPVAPTAGVPMQRAPRLRSGAMACAGTSSLKEDGARSPPRTPSRK